MNRIELGCIVLVFGLLLTFPFTLSAKSEEVVIKGTIKDSLQGTPLSYANITVLSENSSTFLFGTTSNKSGDFKVNSISISKGILKISLVGYQTKTIPFSANGKEVNLETISLTPSSTKIEGVVVKGSKPTIKQVGDVLVFDAKNAPTTSGDFGIDLLRLTPMVFVDPKGDILIQNKPAAILVNGRKLPTSQVYSYINSLKAEDIQSIKVQTSNALENDAETEAGTINIITKKAKVGYKLTTRTSTSYIEQNSNNQNSGFNFSYGAQSWQLYGSFFYSSGNNRWHSKDGYSLNEYINIDKIVLKRSDGFSYPRGDDFRMGAIADLAKNHTIGVELSGKNTFPLQSKSTSQTIYYNHHWDINDTGETQKKSRNTTDLYDASAYYTWKIDTLESQLQILADLVFHKNGNDSFIQSAYQNNTANNFTEQSCTDAKTRNGTFQVDFVKNYMNKLGVQAGAKYVLTNRNSSYAVASNSTPTTSYDVDEDILAFYAAASKTFSKKIFIRLGCRLELANQSGVNRQANSSEQIKSQNNDLFPNFTFSYEIDKNRSLAISYSRSISRMPFFLLSTFTVRNSDYEYNIGNPYLKPILSDRIELRYRYKNHYLTPYFRYSADVVTQSWTVKNGLIYQSNENCGHAIYTGLDYGYNGKVSRWWSLNWNTQVYYAYIPQGFAQTKHFTAAISANNRLGVSPNSSIDLSVFYISSMIEATKLIKGQAYGNIAYNHQFLKKSLNVGVGINDVFQTQRQYVLIKNPELNYTIYGKQPSRTFFVNVSYTFTSKKSVANRSKIDSNDIIRRL